MLRARSTHPSISVSTGSRGVSVVATCHGERIDPHLPTGRPPRTRKPGDFASGSEAARRFTAPLEPEPLNDGQDGERDRQEARCEEDEQPNRPRTEHDVPHENSRSSRAEQKHRDDMVEHEPEATITAVRLRLHTALV